MHCKQARQQIDRLPQPAQASPELVQHTAQCGPCGKFLEERTVLHRALGNLRAETATLGPSSHVEQQVLAALNATASRPRGAQYTWRWIAWRWIATSALVFTALLIATVFSTVSRPHHAAPIVAEIPQEEPFIAMPDVSPPFPHERTTVIRTHVSSQIEQFAGLKVQNDPASTTLADIVLGQDGRLLAFRTVSHPNPVSPRRIN